MTSRGPQRDVDPDDIVPRPLPPWAPIGGAASLTGLLILAVVLLNGVGGDGEGDTAVGMSSAAPATSGSASTSPAPGVSGPLTAAISPNGSPGPGPLATSGMPVTPTDASDFAGTYAWTESASSGPATFIVHVLSLRRDDSGGLVGSLEAQGPQTEESVAVRGVLMNEGLEVSATDSGSGYGEGESLIRLKGDPASPITTLIGLRTLLEELPDEGAYFLPGSGGRSGAADTESAEEAGRS